MYRRVATKGSGDTTEYREASRNAVLLALVGAEEERGRPVTPREIINFGRGNVFAPQSAPVGRSGGWAVFDYGDRVTRHLKGLVRLGLAGQAKNEKGTPVYYALAEGGRLPTLGGEALESLRWAYPLEVENYQPSRSTIPQDTPIEDYISDTVYYGNVPEGYYLTGSHPD